METDEVVVNRDSAKKKIGEEEDRSGSKHISTCTPLLIHTGKGGGGGLDEPVRRLKGR